MYFSRRSDWNRAINRLTRATAPNSLLDLTRSNPSEVGLTHSDDLYRAFGTSDWKHYEPAPRGIDRARHAIAEAEDFDPRNLVLTASTSEAYALLFKVLTDPGDVVALPRPSYPLLETLARLEGLAVRYYDLHYDGQWFIDRTSLTAAAEYSRAVVVVSPNNPTGSYLTEADVALLRELDRPVICDEVFFAYALDASPELRIIDQDLRLTFTLGGLSKLIALPQGKLGWIAVGGALTESREAMSRLEWVNDHYLSAGSPVQHATSMLLDMGAELRSRIQQRLRRNLDQLTERTHGTACTTRKVEGGWTSVLHVPSTLTDEEWALRLVREDAVKVHPGYFYDHSGPESLIMLSLLTDEETFNEGVGRLLLRLED